MNEELSGLRAKLNSLDADIEEMLHFRMVIAEEISRLKLKSGLPIEDPKREREVLEAIKTQCKNPVLLDEIQGIFQILMDCAKKNGFLKHSHPMPFARVAILGWGLMGGSIAKWIKAKNKYVRLAALERACIDLELACEDGLLHKIHSSLDELVEDSDLIVLAVPLSEVIPLSQALANCVKSRSAPLIVMDIGSVKEEIAKTFESLTRQEIEFVATHPMAGSDKQGYANSKTTLLYNAPWIITPHKRNRNETISQVKSLIEFFGAVPLHMDPALHDQEVALVSHIPGLLSADYLNFVEETDAHSLSIAGPGFRSFTRLAHANPALRRDIKEANAKWISHYLERWRAFGSQ